MDECVGRSRGLLIVSAKGRKRDAVEVLPRLVIRCLVLLVQVYYISIIINVCNTYSPAHPMPSQYIPSANPTPRKTEYPKSKIQNLNPKPLRRDASLKLKDIIYNSSSNNRLSRNLRPDKPPPIPSHPSPPKPIQLQPPRQLLHLPLRALVPTASNAHTSQHTHTLQHPPHRLRQLLAAILNLLLAAPRVRGARRKGPLRRRDR